MTMMSGALYDALRSAKVDDGLARQAAEEVADIRSEFAKLQGRFDTLEARFDLVKWMVGVNLTISLLGLGSSIGVLYKLAGH